MNNPKENSVSSVSSVVNKPVRLTARVEWEDTRFVARVDGINVAGEGESPEAAKAELVQAMLSWISNRDCADGMADALSEAGFPEIDDDTELELEFDES